MKVKDYTSIGERVFHEKLLNGLPVYVVSKPGYSKGRAFFTVNYGGADRRFKANGKWLNTPAGIAHYLEHKMFDMEDGNALGVLFANGASANAFTSSDMTAYHFECTENFEQNLRTLLKFVSTPYFTEESVEKERGIIGQEIRMTEDSPETAGYFGLLKLMYKKHPMRDSIVGTVDDIAQITPQMLYDCHGTFYTNTNMVLCVVGDVDPDMVARAAEEILPKARGEAPIKDYGRDDAPSGKKRSVKAQMVVGMPLLFAGARLEKVPNERILQQEVTAQAALRLLIGRSSPLYMDLYSRGLIGRDFLGQYDRIAGQAMLIFSGESRDPEAVAEAISERAESILNEDFSEAFERQKKALIGARLRELNSFSDVCYNVAKGCFDGYDPFEAISALQGITAKSVRDMISESLSPEKLMVSAVVPK